MILSSKKGLNDRVLHKKYLFERSSCSPEYIKNSYNSTTTTNNSIEKCTKDSIRRFSKEVYKWPISLKEWRSMPLITRKMQVKIAVRYQGTPIRMAAIRNTESNKCRQECREIRPLTHYHRVLKWHSRYVRSKTIPQKIKNRIAIWSRQFHLWTYTQTNWEQGLTQILLNSGS